jgi:hypothetical protein
MQFLRTGTVAALIFGLAWTATPAQATPPVSVPITTSGLISEALPLYSCNTTYGISSMKPVKLPKAVRALVPHNTVVKLAVFADGLGIIRLVGPAEWDCSATVGADGVSSLAIYPPNTLARFGVLPSTSKVQEITGNQNGGCVGCGIMQACPLFSNARELAAGLPCPAKARLEKMTWISGHTAEFVDPPGVHGDGNPSGGAYISYGVLEFDASRDRTSWLTTCDLQSKYQGVCAADLINFATEVNGK